MKARIFRYAPQLSLFLLGLGVMYWMMPHIFLSPNGYLLDEGIDGFRNYFAYTWYGKYDGGMMFSGMNYPYPQHLFFCEVIPGLSAPLSWLGQEEVMVGVLHVLLILCFPLSVILLYTILKNWEIHWLYAMLASLLIGMMSPQLMRLSGHFSLAFLVFIPALLRILQLEEKLKLTMYAWAAGLILVFSTFHGYYLMIGSSLLLGYLLFDVIYDEERRAHLKRHLVAFGITLSPIIMMGLFLALTDNVVDRPTHPYGYFAYQTQWEGLFLPAEGPIFEFINGLVEVRKLTLESKVYVGLLGTSLFLYLLFRWTKNLIQKNGISYFPQGTPPQLVRWVQLSLLILLFSTAFPFFLGMRNVLDYLPILKQFRSLGRFGWIFFYTWSLFLAVCVYHRFQAISKMKGQGVAYTMLGFVFLFWGLEGYTFLSGRKSGISHSPNPFTAKTDTYQDTLDEKGLSKTDFQSILPLPLYHIGSEKFSPIQIDPVVFKESLIASYELGVPQATGFLPRSSFQQALNILQLNAHPWLPRKILSELDNSRKILVVSKESEPYLDPAGLEKKGVEIAHMNGVRLKELGVHELGSQNPPLGMDIASESWTELEDGSWQSNDTLPLWYQGFDGTRPDQAILGEKTFSYDYGKEVIFDHPLSVFQQGERITLSIWVKADLRRDAFPHVHIYQLTPQWEEVEHLKLDPKFSNDICENWVRVEASFPVYAKVNQLKIQITGKFAEVESLLLAPEGALPEWELGNGERLLANYPLSSE
ncbi:MAG: hypothetical protein AAGC85_19645 [Bacteroidota bacterium]